MTQAPGTPAYGLLCALPQELGGLEERAVRGWTLHGLDVCELELAGQRVLATVSGVGKVRAARGATTLIHAGALRGLLVVGTCGSLQRALGPGALVHCARAVQADFALREDREVEPDAALLEAWSRTVEGPRGWFLTADRPALGLWRRLRLRRAWESACVVDMETAAVAAVASRAGVPWAALRAVTDGMGPGGVSSFRKHFPEQAGRAARTVEALLAGLDAGEETPNGSSG